jgi:hypothetical protein
VFIKFVECVVCGLVVNGYRLFCDDVFCMPSLPYGSALHVQVTSNKLVRDMFGVCHNVPSWNGGHVRYRC